MSNAYNRALTAISRYEMKVFTRAIRDFSRIKWNGNVPESLNDIELEAGDYFDPWDSEYFYEKKSVNSAVLISAGPDKLLHTRDDIIMWVST